MSPVLAPTVGFNPVSSNTDKPAEVVASARPTLMQQLANKCKTFLQSNPKLGMATAAAVATASLGALTLPGAGWLLSPILAGSALKLWNVASPPAEGSFRANFSTAAKKFVVGTAKAAGEVLLGITKAPLLALGGAGF